MNLEDLKAKRKQMQANMASSEIKTTGNLEELKKKRQKINENSVAVLDNMQMIADESIRVAEVAHNSREILNNLDREFERQTGLNKSDFAFLFYATALQIIRIAVINEIFKIENAGTSELEKDLKRTQKRIFDKFEVVEQESAGKYYAPLNQIISIPGVPYDTNKYSEGNYGLFTGANHRFATVGHDPLLGLVFGTANILTNTITCVDESLLGYGRKGNAPRTKPIGKPIITTNHVRYSEKIQDKIIRVDGLKQKQSKIHFSTPQIGESASTILTIKHAASRVDSDMKSVVAAIIKQIIHIGTDLFTPCGIQLPAANLVLSNDKVEEITKNFGMGDIVKIGNSAAISTLINLIISTLHGLTFDESKDESREVYTVKTRKIIMWSNTIATGSNLIWVGANVAAGDRTQIKNLDIGGLMITLYRLIHDPEFIRKVKEEFVFGRFNQMIQGEPIQLNEVKEL